MFRACSSPRTLSHILFPCTLAFSPRRTTEANSPLKRLSLNWLPLPLRLSGHATTPRRRGKKVLKIDTRRGAAVGFQALLDTVVPAAPFRRGGSCADSRPCCR
ncbi:hypothetical protein E2C01_089730 [Portunus trituberculatus]|uniref:Uncharacterized protein n=1 Tax=Portunus trituberculatus TaxID=210409 RepID=A0A5B7JJW7_PORTR|nr:hypothetical protein [Portunus trituberculatus]